MGRPKKAKVVEAVPELVEPEAPVVALESSPTSETGLFDDDFPDLPDDIPVVRPDDGIPPLDSGLSPDEKQIFIKLLNTYMPLKKRAVQLTKLAMLIDTKRAPVGLRAIQEINAICGLSSDKPREAGPMFVLPANSKIAVLVNKGDK